MNDELQSDLGCAIMIIAIGISFALFELIAS